jgi:hypothetical protein
MYNLLVASLLKFTDLDFLNEESILQRRAFGRPGCTNPVYSGFIRDIEHGSSTPDQGRIVLIERLQFFPIRRVCVCNSAPFALRHLQRLAFFKRSTWEQLVCATCTRPVLLIERRLLILRLLPLKMWPTM